jgi:hypothetical protein
MISDTKSESEETNFVEFRRKVRSAEVLSSAMERLLWSLQFTGRVSVVEIIPELSPSQTKREKNKRTRFLEQGCQVIFGSRRPLKS